MSECSFGGCTKPAIWTRKEGWSVAPGSPPGDVCEEHHCWEKIPRNVVTRAELGLTEGEQPLHNMTPEQRETHAKYAATVDVTRDALTEGEKE